MANRDKRTNFGLYISFNGTKRYTSVKKSLLLIVFILSLPPFSVAVPEIVL
jgi:hypothetical protein